MLSLRLVLKYCAMHVLDVTWITRVFEHGGGPHRKLIFFQTYIARGPTFTRT